MAIFSGKIALESTPQAIRLSKTHNNTITIYANEVNAQAMEIGNKKELESSEGFELVAGSALTIELEDIYVIWVKGISGDHATYLVNGVLT